MNQGKIPLFETLSWITMADKSTSVSIQLKRPQFRHSREGGNPEIIVITNTGFLLSQE